jgi:hypothetical protein
MIGFLPGVTCVLGSVTTTVDALLGVVCTSSICMREAYLRRGSWCGFNEMRCIYCLKEEGGPSSKAHIFAESIFGDQEDLVLVNGEVCPSCNRKLSHDESAFKDRLGFIPMVVGPGRSKSGRPTTVNVPGLNATRDPRDPRISLNVGRQAWAAPDGRHVRPALKKGEKVEFFHGGQGPDGYHQFRFTQEMRIDDVFVRILTKIAFETICVHRGADYCSDLRWGRIRAFILRSEGQRTYAAPKSRRTPPGPGGALRIPVGIGLVPFEVSGIGPPTEEWIACVMIGTTFAIDMSPDNMLLPMIMSGPLRQYRDLLVIETCKGTREAAKSGLVT